MPFAKSVKNQIVDKSLKKGRFSSSFPKFAVKSEEIVISSKLKVSKKKNVQKIVKKKTLKVCKRLIKTS